jgi:hypothetical protein
VDEECLERLERGLVVVDLEVKVGQELEIPRGSGGARLVRRDDTLLEILDALALFRCQVRLCRH